MPAAPLPVQSPWRLLPTAGATSQSDRVASLPGPVLTTKACGLSTPGPPCTCTSRRSKGTDGADPAPMAPGSPHRPVGGARMPSVEFDGSCVFALGF